MRFRVVVRKVRGYYYAQVPSLSQRSLLFACAVQSWHKAVAYVACRNAGCLHKDAVAMARRMNKEWRTV